jgi:hypothetical protein
VQPLVIEADKCEYLTVLAELHLGEHAMALGAIWGYISQHFPAHGVSLSLGIVLVADRFAALAQRLFYLRAHAANANACTRAIRDYERICQIEREITRLRVQKRLEKIKGQNLRKNLPS